MGEFGPNSKYQRKCRRDHYPAAWSAVLAGAGVAGGQAYGKTDEGGMAVVEGQMSAEDLLATLCMAAGVDPKKSQADDNDVQLVWPKVPPSKTCCPETINSMAAHSLKSRLRSDARRFARRSLGLVALLIGFRQPSRTRCL